MCEAEMAPRHNHIHVSSSLVISCLITNAVENASPNTGVAAPSLPCPMRSLSMGSCNQLKAPTLELPSTALGSRRLRNSIMPFIILSQLRKELARSRLQHFVSHVIVKIFVVIWNRHYAWRKLLLVWLMKVRWRRRRWPVGHADNMRQSVTS